MNINEINSLSFISFALEGFLIMIIGPIYPEKTPVSFLLKPNIKLNEFESKIFLFLSNSNCIISPFPL